MKRVLAIVIFLIGFLLILFPFVSGDKAYYAGDNYFLNLKDSVELKFPQYLISLAQKSRSAKAFNAKKALRNQMLPLSDSLDRAELEAKEKNKLTELEKISAAKKALNYELNEKEFNIDQQYAFESLDGKEKERLIDSIEQTVTLDDFLIKYANDLVNPTGNSNTPSLTTQEISIKKVNRQSTTPFIVSGTIIALLGLLLMLYFMNFFSLDHVGTRRIVTAALGLLIIVLSYLIYQSFNQRLKFEATLKEREKIVKERLEQAKSLQLVFFEANGKYANNWSQLIEFGVNDSIPILKILVNPDDTAAVNKAKALGNPLTATEMIAAKDKAFPSVDVNINEVSKVPFSEREFDLNAGIITKNSREIHVFEIKTQKGIFLQDLKFVPENFDSTKELILGSMKEPTTEGNW